MIRKAIRKIVHDRTPDKLPDCHLGLADSLSFKDIVLMRINGLVLEAALAHIGRLFRRTLPTLRTLLQGGPAFAVTVRAFQRRWKAKGLYLSAFAICARPEDRSVTSWARHARSPAETRP